LDARTGQEGLGSPWDIPKREFEEGRMRKILSVGLFSLMGASGAFAQVPFSLTVSGRQAKADIDLPGGLETDLTLTFENVVGLTPSSVSVLATVVNPLDPTLLARLPGLAQVSVPGAFPVLLQVDPSASSVLTFEGVYKISLHTHNLQLDPAVPLALFKAPDGGLFRDVTQLEGRGSYRVDGGGGDFSEFLIVVDARPIDTVIVDKFNALQGLLNTYGGSIPSAVLTTLQGQLTQALTLYQAGAIRQAIIQINGFSEDVKAHSGDDIPAVWRAQDPSRVDIAGLLRVAAGTLGFSLDRKTNALGSCIP
jgi:hypothetical protein